jgi:uncharacterized OsmC-like protein
MSDTDATKAAIERTINVFTQRPGAARSTYKVTAQLGDGLTATTREGRWSVDFDMPVALGGGGASPTPGVYGRATLLGCLAIGIRLEALQAGLALDAVDLSMEVDCDDRGLFGLADVPPGYEAFRIQVAVKSRAPEADVRRLIDQALARSPWYDVFSRAQNIRADIAVSAPQAAG